MAGRRRWLQFSLRGFLVLLTALAVCLGIVLGRIRERREAVKAIEALGGQVLYDWQLDRYFVPKPAPKLAAEPGGRAWLRRIIGDDFFQAAATVTFQRAEEKDILKARRGRPVLHFFPRIKSANEPRRPLS